MIAIGIDIGGTSIKGASVNEKGEVGEIFSLPIDYNLKQEEIIKDLIEMVEKYIKDNHLDNKICGIGLGIPGSIDSQKGEVSISNNLGWKHLNVVSMFKKHFSCPIKITNDANAAALSEAKFGAGKEFKNVVMITLGTGVGSGIIIDGKIYDGLEGKGAELGHSTLILGGLECTCGRRGCVEMYCSATALVRQTKEAMENHKDSLLWKEFEKTKKVNGRLPFECAKMGDKTSIEVIDKYVYYLGESLLNICNIFRPDCIVLSGGIANQGDFLINKLVTYCKKQDFGYPESPETQIKCATVGYNSGIIGAASLVL